MIQQAYKYVSLSLWPCLTFFQLKITYILKSSGWGLEKSELPHGLLVAMGKKCFIDVGVFPVEVLAYQVSMVCAANWPRSLYLYA